MTSSARKLFHHGTHRLVPPAETLERVRRLMRVMGITRIANVTGLDHIGIPVVTVCRPNARSVSVSQGKGLDLLAAKASGVMEAVEAYHAERITLPLKLATFNQLRFTHSMAELEALPRLSVGSFHPNLRLLWIEGHDLLQDQEVWLPYEMVHTDYTLPLPAGSGSFFMSTNGLASGNHLREAISHGICEIVERDATTLWHLQEEDVRQRTMLDLSTVDHPDCRDVLDRYRRENIAVAVWETTSDIGIPSFLCVIRDDRDDPLRYLYSTHGMGCHPSRHIALLRALTEAAQTRLTLISGSRDESGRSRYEELRDPDVVKRLRARMEATVALRSFARVPTFSGETFDEDVAWELDRLRAAGITQVVVVDLTKPEFKIPVVRVVIPGLESIHDAPGYVPGNRARALLARRMQEERPA